MAPHSAKAVGVDSVMWESFGAWRRRNDARRLSLLVVALVFAAVGADYVPALLPSPAALVSAVSAQGALPPKNTTAPVADDREQLDLQQIQQLQKLQQLQQQEKQQQMLLEQQLQEQQHLQQHLLPPQQSQQEQQQQPLAVQRPGIAIGNADRTKDAAQLAEGVILNEQDHLGSAFPARWPRNLNRIYDGTWVSVKGRIPFGEVPMPNAQSQYPASFGSPPGSRERYVASDMVAFEKKAGFALLTAENNDSQLGPTVNYMLGELLIRDGAYKTIRDVSMRVIGVYDWQTGTIVFVGDILSDSDPLSRLYTAYMSLPYSAPADAKKGVALRTMNFTSSEFVSALMIPLTANKKRNRIHKSSGYRRYGDVASSCPFETVITITPGSFSDSVQAPQPASLGLTGVRDAQSTNTMGHDESQEQLVEMSGTFSSSVCETTLNLVLSTLDTDTLLGKAVNYTLLVIFVAFAQVLVLIRQMEMTATQAGASRVSLVTVGLQAVADSYLCLGHLTMGIAIQTLFNAFATAAFFKFIIFSIFEMRYMLCIWKARRPSGFTEGWESMRRELSMLYSRFYGSLLIGIILLYQMQRHLRFFMFALYSFWLPQIILSAVEDHRRPLHPVYILGMSTTRLAIPLYFWSCPKNFLHIEPQFSTAMTLFSWVGLQAGFLLSQQKLGARWFIPKRLLPEKYDYFRSLNVTSVILKNGGNNFGPLSAREIDCVICMLPVVVASRVRMTTPCDHVFHDECLQQWMDIKMECPTCRRLLPPP